MGELVENRNKMEHYQWSHRGKTGANGATVMDFNHDCYFLWSTKRACCVASLAAQWVIGILCDIPLIPRSELFSTEKTSSMSSI